MGSRTFAERCRLLLLLTAQMLPVLACAAPPYTFAKPDFLGPPLESKTLMGATYTYLPSTTAAAQLLMITMMPGADIRQRFGELSNVQCINLFLAELKTTHERFFVVAQKRPVRVGVQEFVQFRWTGDKNGKALTGILSCGILGDAYVVVHFADELSQATHSFPSIRQSLKSLVLGGG